MIKYEYDSTQRLQRLRRRRRLARANIKSWFEWDNEFFGDEDDNKKDCHFDEDLFEI